MTFKTSLCAGVALSVAMLAAGAANAQDTTVAWKGAPQWTNDTLTFKVRGRTYFDYIYQDVDRQTGVDFAASNSRIRTARIGVEGTWNANWAYKAEVQLARGAAEWEDLILEYKPTDTTSILVGNFKTVSLENITSSRYTTFMERGPYNDVLNVGRVMNIQAKTNGQNWTAAIAASGDSINSADVATNSATGSKEVFGVNGRFTFAPIDLDETKLHLGVWARYRNREDQANFNYAVRNNTAYGAQYASTGAIGVRDTQIGLEGALVHKNFSLQGEYANISVDRPANADADLRAFYVYGSWFPTGEMRRYEANKGEFNRTKVLNPVTSGGMGALELAVRYDNVDLTDVAGAGEYSAVTLGANWYPHPYVRFMANYSMAQNDNPAVGADVDVNTFQVRAQFDF
ncbi:OprO/OprP family phosphate-selective porin [Phenylobacterium sp.]|uniref:OprO/OprP family phosphate-selective porin n=1 Tax=Phenylobacterium sp. TaxID=1871053 RepID=UPI00272387C9|nr:porin [Phenylobacterium sp.]MDO8380026.1 porin [Phenylobacterium sp.]